MMKKSLEATIEQFGKLGNGRDTDKSQSPTQYFCHCPFTDGSPIVMLTVCITKT